MDKHTLKRENNGKGMGGSTTPTCSCGWSGIPANNYNSDQNGMLEYQEAKHIEDSKSGRDPLADALSSMLHSNRY